MQSSSSRQSWFSQRKLVRRGLPGGEKEPQGSCLTQVVQPSPTVQPPFSTCSSWGWTLPWRSQATAGSWCSPLGQQRQGWPQLLEGCSVRWPAASGVGAAGRGKELPSVRNDDEQAIGRTLTEPLQKPKLQNRGEWYWVIMEAKEERHEDADPLGGEKLRACGFGQLASFSLWLFS